MNTSFLNHAFGLREQYCSCVRYEYKSIILELQTCSHKLRCSECHSRDIIRSGSNIRRIKSIPIGKKPVILEMKVQRLECKSCHVIRQENLHFVTGKRSYSNKMARYVVDLSRIGTIKDVANLVNLSWDTVKEIQKKYLYRHYNNPDLKGVRRIGIDEFAVRKGHVYKTIVVDLETGRVIYIGDGKGSRALDDFWKKVKKAGVKIEAIASDLSAAFISSVMTNAADATLVFDHFHVVKLVNDALDQIRRDLYRDEKDLNKRKIMKGTRWLLLCSGKDIYDQKFKSKLDNALNLNESLMKAYYLKESIREIWNQIDKKNAEKVLEEWLEQAYQAKVPRLKKLANTIKAHSWGILNWYDYHISTAKIEGINNKIKTMKRQAYGYRDQKFFELKILALHDKNYAFVG